MSEEIFRDFCLTLKGVGAMNSPRYAPAGLLVEHGDTRVMFDGGPGAEPKGAIHAWLVTDGHGELIRQIRGLARAKGVEPCVCSFNWTQMRVEPHEVVHTSHPAYGYLIRAGRKRIVWAPEFLTFPEWAEEADLMFAEAAGWNRPIRFAGGVGGHAAALEVSRTAQALGVRRLVFAHIGRPTIRAIDAGQSPPFGEFGFDGSVYRLRGAKRQS
jgi:Beta-lactamase superfamily domain